MDPLLDRIMPPTWLYDLRRARRDSVRRPVSFVDLPVEVRVMVFKFALIVEVSLVPNYSP